MPRRNQKLTFSELRVGIFMLSALVITGFLILNSSGNFNPFEKKMRLKARFVSADGLHSGADVQLAGVSIGKVEDVKFLPQFRLSETSFGEPTPALPECDLSNDARMN